MASEIMNRFALDNGLVQEEGEPIDRAGIGSELAESYNQTPGAFRYLQTLIAGEGVPLPYAPPSVRIVVAKDGWKEDCAFVYGFPIGESTDGSGRQEHSTLATRFPAEAERFKVYYGANYGSGGYSRVETIEPLSPDAESRLAAGEFTDREVENLLAERNRLIDIYWELNMAARDPLLNPDYADRVNEAFYRRAEAGGL